MEKDYFKISRNELRRLLILEMYFDAIIKLSPTGDFYGEIYRGLTGEKLTIPNDQAHFIKRVNFVNGEIIKQTDETLEKLDLVAKKHGFE